MNATETPETWTPLKTMHLSREGGATGWNKIASTHGNEVTVLSETPESALALAHRVADFLNGSLERRLTTMTRERDERLEQLKAAQIAAREMERHSAQVTEIANQRLAERDKARACLKVCAGLAEHWRMQASVTSRRSAWSANGALEKCAVELEKALARIDQIGKEANE